MNYQTLSPSDCAQEIMVETLKTAKEACRGCTDCRAELFRFKLEDLIRQKIRLIIEQCAMIAEDYVGSYDMDEQLDGMRVGDAIAEQIRQFAEERKEDLRNRPAW